MLWSYFLLANLRTFSKMSKASSSPLLDSAAADELEYERSALISKLELSNSQTKTTQCSL